MKVGDLIKVRYSNDVPWELKGRYGIIISIFDTPDRTYEVIVQGRPDLPFTFFDDEIIPVDIQSDHIDQE